MLVVVENGDIFSTKASALVNPVNTLGVMGKGLALSFKEKYPTNFKVYKEKCVEQSFGIGSILLLHEKGKYIINFPTKAHWRSPSRLSYIEDGLKGLSKKLEDYPEITSIAFPKLGCGLGGLSWDKVYPMINYFSYKLPNLDIEVYV